MRNRGHLKGRCHLQIVLVDVPLSSVPARNVRVGIYSPSESRPASVSGGKLTEDSKGGGIELGSGKDRGRLASIADDLRIVIKGDGIRDKVGAEMIKDQCVSSLEESEHTLEGSTR